MLTIDQPLTAQNLEMDLVPDAFGALRDSSDIAGDAASLRERMKTEGYLYLPGLLNRADVLAARRVVTERLLRDGYLDPSQDPMESFARPETNVSFLPELAEKNPELRKVLYSGAMMEFFTMFLGGPVRHYDFTWFRAVAPGVGAMPHADVPYMGRGTHNVFTAWTPIGDVDFEQGGLIVLENSQPREFDPPLS